MKLSQHFELSEFTRSTKAEALKINNDLPPELTPRVVMLAELLERIREALGVPLLITSGYRSQQLNIAVGGVTSSDHSQGHAADIVAPLFGSALEVATKLAPLVSVLGIGQLILECIAGKSWVHISTRSPEKCVNRILTITGNSLHIGILDPL